METTLYPNFKQVALEINRSQRIFFTDGELSSMLQEQHGTDAYRFALMQLQDHLLEEYQINFIRSENEETGKGYKKASPEENVRVTAERLHRKFRAVACRQRKVLDIVDRSELNEETKHLYDRHMIKNGLMVSFLNKTPLSRCLPGVNVRVDIPKMITE